MEIKGKVHCFFEQSGTFKNEFKKLGYEAFDYDIQNNFGETDFVIDLFTEIEKGYAGEKSIFDNITKDDLIIAFFPCIYFCEKSQMAMTLNYFNYRKLSTAQKLKKIIKRAEQRQVFYDKLLKMCFIVEDRVLRMIIENPYSPNLHFLNLNQNFAYKPNYIDKDRSKRGDYFKKKTQYYFIGCKPTQGFTTQQNNNTKTIKKTKCSRQEGLCSEERSMISPDYSRNFICDQILGKKQFFPGVQLKLF